MTRFDVSAVGFAVLDILGRPVTRIPEGGRADFIEEIRIPRGKTVMEEKTA